MDIKNIGFIGFGLIGGSIARALKEFGSDYTIVVYNHSEQTNSSFDTALTDSVIDYLDNDLSTHFGDCDVIFLCAPVLDNIFYLEKLKPIIKQDCLITDVGSVKGNICSVVKTLNLEKNFVGGHPMCGSEKTGYINSSSRLFENVYYILTPSADTPASLIDKLIGLIKELHALPILLDVREHDDIVAAISHVPHIIASTLVKLVKDNDDSANHMMSLAAGGFKDITRIASSSPAMWQNICLSNAESILKFLSLMKESIDMLSSYIVEKDAKSLLEYFDSSKNYRDQIPNTNGSILNRTYDIYVDIIDETGAIASLSTLLASNGISIKNIGILHNREFIEGVLRIELYDSLSCEKATALFQKHRYTVYKR